MAGRANNTMNPHTTPRVFPTRSLGPSASQQQQQQQQQQTQHQQFQQHRQSLAPQNTSSEEYGAIADEDREHIDEVVRRPNISSRNSCPATDVVIV